MKAYLEIERPVGNCKCNYAQCCELYHWTLRNPHPKCPLKPMSNLINADDLVERINDKMAILNDEIECEKIMKMGMCITEMIIEQMTKEQQ